MDALDGNQLVAPIHAVLGLPLYDITGLCSQKVMFLCVFVFVHVFKANLYLVSKILPRSSDMNI